ncbi:MAG: hypothetical protein J7L15_03220 [Clostridiales bacterium]|nr:hypothetical protein [Clostridiales bacterium]
MAYLDRMLALVPTNGLGEINAINLQDCFIELEHKVGKLGEVTEGPEGLEKTGYRLYEPAETYNYTGDTGERAVDLSTQFDVSVINGALGNYSFISGLGTRTDASSLACASLGKYNIGYGTSMLEVGIGINNSNRLNALEIRTDGGIVAPECTNDLIETLGPKALVTKEYADSKTFSIEDDFINASDAQTSFVFFKKASYVQVFGDGIKHSVNDSNNSLASVVMDNNFDTTGKITVTFSVGQATGTYIEIICYN